MLISKKWIANYIPDILQIDDAEIAESLTIGIAEVEDVITRGEGLEKVVVGRILAVKKHPEADKLNVCQVDVGNEKLEIVCGAPNVREDILVPVVLVGGQVVDSDNGKVIPIKATKLRGIESQGMILSEKELGISDNHEGIMILDEGHSPGAEFDDLVKDTVFEIENKSLTHRGDCFSHLGIARELSAIFNLDIKLQNSEVEPVQTDTLPFEVSVETEKCFQFFAITIKNVNVQDSPLWLKLALSSIGVRSVNNVVDISNYLMHGIGQPLHIYDYDKINGNKLIIREARGGERLKAIDHNEYQLNSGDIVITDTKQVQALAGIMGAEGSEVTSETKNIVIESAQFDNEQVLRTSRELTLRSESGIRFSKGIDPTGTVSAVKLALNLLVDLSQGDVASELLEIKVAEQKETELEFDLQLIPRISGTTIDTESALIYLERLGIEVQNRNAINSSANMLTMPQIAKLKIPAHRADLTIGEDIVEEVVRIHGYDRIEPTTPTTKIKAHSLTGIGSFKRRVGDNIINLGYTEQKTYSFISEQLHKLFGLDGQNALEVNNAISPELNFVRSSLIPSLYESLLKNNRNFTGMKLFEISRTVDPENKDEDGIPIQNWKLAGIADIARENSRETFLALKADIEILFEALRLPSSSWSWGEPRFISPKLHREFMHPDRSSAILLGEQPIGVFVEIHPAICRESGYDEKIVAFEIDLDLLLNSGLVDQRGFNNISTMPSTCRDLSYWVKDDLKIGELIGELDENKVAIEKNEELDLQIELADEYFDFEKGRSITLTVEIQPKEKTLTDEETARIVQSLVTTTEKKYKIQQR